MRSLDDGSGAVLREVIDQYLAQSAEGRGELVRLVDAHDAAGVKAAAHALKGASANVGAAAVAAMCAELEALGAAGRLEDAAGVVDRLGAELSRVSDALSVLRREVVECAS